MFTHVDVLIVGGGVIGLTLARHLRGEGLSVCLVDRHECGREASWAGAGILAPCNPQRDDPLFHFQERSLALFPSLCAELESETGIDPEYERSGELELLFTEQALAIARADERGAAGRLVHGNQPRVELLTPPRVRQEEPAVTTGLLGALLCRHTAQVRNPRLLAALHASCTRRGVEIRERTSVHEVLRSGGRVTGVRADRGDIHAEAVILCAGAWSAQIGGGFEWSVPVYPVRGQIILLRCEEQPFRRIIARGKTYLVPRRDGHVLIGSTEEPEAGFVKRNTPLATARLLQQAVTFVPALADAPVAAMWSGLRPATRDDKPILGPVPGVQGLFVATGHFRSGLTNAPATAEWIAACLAGRPYSLDLSMCLPDRKQLP